MARLFWWFMLLSLKNVVLSDRPKPNCSVTAATSQHFKVGNCAAKLLPRASKAAQRFCIPLQLELSCYLASKMPLNSCNLAVQLFWSDFKALYSAASFVQARSLDSETSEIKLGPSGLCFLLSWISTVFKTVFKNPACSKSPSSASQENNCVKTEINRGKVYPSKKSQQIYHRKELLPSCV